MKKFLIAALCLASVTALSQITRSKTATTAPAKPAGGFNKEAFDQRKKILTTMLEKRIEFIKEEITCTNASKNGEDLKKCWDTAKKQHESIRPKPPVQPQPAAQQRPR